MDEPAAHTVKKAVDSIQQRLTSFACGLRYEDLPPNVIHAAKVRAIDTLGALIGGFFGEPCRIARNLAAQMPNPNGATLIGTRMKSTPDMAAFVNAITARYIEMNDSYHGPGSAYGHASDTLAAVFTTAEHARNNGRELIAAIVVAYEIYLRFSDVFHNRDAFDPLNFASLGTAAAAGKLLGLNAESLSHCISMAAVPNIILMQARRGHKSMFKGAAAGQAGRAGVFAALLAQAGMEGPHLPFEGKAGWCDHVARERFALDVMGGNGVPFKILQTQIKPRPSNGSTIGCILAAEKIAPLDIKQIKRVTVEVYQHAKHAVGSSEELWHPDSRETADHSIPYVVAATLLDGTVTLRSFDDAHLWNSDLRALMQRIEVVENEEFTKAFNRLPVEHRIRVSVWNANGEQLVGEAGGDKGDLAAPKSDAEIEQKFRTLTSDYLSVKQTNTIFERLWNLEQVSDVAQIPSHFVLD